MHRLREKPFVSRSLKKMMKVLKGLERKILEGLRVLSFYDAVVLLVILAFTALFLVYPMPELKWDSGRLGTSGILWHDVIRNVVLTGRFDSAKEFVETYLNQYESDVFYYPVFWGLVCGSSFFFFGISEAAFYLVVLFFALATILATYLLASSLYDKRVGVISSLFIASSNALFAYTKSGEIDVPATAMVTLSMFAFIKAEADKRWVYSVLAGILVGLSFMTKPTTTFVIAPIAIYSVLKYLRSRDKKIGNLIISRRFEKKNLRKDLRNLIIMLILASILGLFQMYIWASSGAISSWLEAFSGPPLIFFPWHSYFSWLLTEYFSPIVVALFMVGFLFSLGRRKSADVFLLTWFATFILFAILASTRQPRYLLTSVPCLSVIAAQGLISLYNSAREKLKIRRRNVSIKNLTASIFIILIISGIASGFVSIQRDPYKNQVDFTNIDESPYDEVAKFLVEKAGVTCILPDDIGWAVLSIFGVPCSSPTLEFHILKYDRQRTTYFYSSYITPWVTVEDETFLESLDQLSDSSGGKTVYVVVPNVYNWSREFIEYLPSVLELSMSAYLKPYQKMYSYIESHSELIPRVAVFTRGGLEIRVYQRIKGKF